MASPDNVSLSGLTESEAQEIHKYFIQGFLGFTAVAIVAHLLVWLWRPWIPGPDGYAALDGVTETVTALLPVLA
ncbi:MAG: light-harvesting protein [Rhodobacteraceae bacterium]|jgi:light-harvesting complex 1 beta chain|uniref:light-harvesting antenna LH1, beta subunit n=1 Tax=Stappia TaxID=152161 RepID=UPI000C4FB2C6|nr:light-harvesting antenna LH1, beta subunit [Stappia stellulata]MBC00851.1 light-harvesting protein [Paracoccaceae bacterium]MCA1244015.1 light-harvesting protein [Stappia stellulata]